MLTGFPGNSRGSARDGATNGRGGYRVFFPGITGVGMGGRSGFVDQVPVK